jgi:gluconate 5-dehydrogenase
MIYVNSKNLFDLTGKVAVVTGASSGLGVQMAKALARQGADIVVLARRKDRLDKVAEDIKALGVKCLAVQCDVTDTASIQTAVSAVKAEYGRADILINNAGSGGVGPAETTSDDDWNHTVSVDLNGVFKVAREFGKLMIENKYGRIINIASMYGMVGNMALPTAAYHAAKGGVINLTRALAAEWAKHGITVNAICPGYFATELTEDTLKTESFSNYMKASVPVGRYGHEGELDSAAIFLSSEGSAYVTGVILPVDGGYTCV